VNSWASSKTFGFSSAGKKDSKALVIDAVGEAERVRVVPAILVTVVAVVGDGKRVLGMTTVEPTIRGGEKGRNKTSIVAGPRAGVDNVTVVPTMFVIVVPYAK
jgi:hypothetical protein